MRYGADRPGGGVARFRRRSLRSPLWRVPYKRQRREVSCGAVLRTVRLPLESLIETDHPPVEELAQWTPLTEWDVKSLASFSEVGGQVTLRTSPHIITSKIGLLIVEGFPIRLAICLLFVTFGESSHSCRKTVVSILLKFFRLILVSRRYFTLVSSRGKSKYTPHIG